MQWQDARTCATNASDILAEDQLYLTAPMWDPPLGDVTVKRGVIVTLAVRDGNNSKISWDERRSPELDHSIHYTPPQERQGCSIPRFTLIYICKKAEVIWQASRKVGGPGSTGGSFVPDTLSWPLEKSESDPSNIHVTSVRSGSTSDPRSKQ